MVVKIIGDDNRLQYIVNVPSDYSDQVQLATTRDVSPMTEPPPYGTVGKMFLGENAVFHTITAFV